MSKGLVKFGLPPDLMVFGNASAQQEYWHLPRSVWESINSRVTGKGVLIANLDTGYNPNHSLIPKPKAVRSFVDRSGGVDGHGHGSHTIGTCCGRDPAISPAFEADLIVGKVLDDRGSGPSSAIAEGINWAIREGADIISMSLGGPSKYEPTKNALREAEQKGVVVIAAAGNSGFSGRIDTVGFPAAYLSTLCVGAMGEGGKIAHFSSGGRALDIAVPGENIVSCSHKPGNGLTRMSGTSMATPFFAALAALVVELHLREGKRLLKGTEAWRRFLSTQVTDLGPPGRDPQYGYGVPRYGDIINGLDNEEFVWV